MPVLLQARVAEALLAGHAVGRGGAAAAAHADREDALDARELALAHVGRIAGRALFARARGPDAAVLAAAAARSAAAARAAAAAVGLVRAAARTALLGTAARGERDRHEQHATHALHPTLHSRDLHPEPTAQSEPAPALLASRWPPIPRNQRKWERGFEHPSTPRAAEHRACIARYRRSRSSRRVTAARGRDTERQCKAFFNHDRLRPPWNCEMRSCS